MNQRWTLAALLIVACTTVWAGDSQRGRMLYETRCGACHAESVHGRAKRTAADCSDIRNQVVRWNAYLGGTWTRDEIDDVTLWLNERFYRFPMPNGECAKPVADSSPHRPG